MKSKGKLILDNAGPVSAVMIGLTAHDDIWKICWGINQTMHIDLSVSKDEEYHGFEAYTAIDPNLGLRAALIRNRKLRQYFVPKAREFTYILQWFDEAAYPEKSSLLKKLHAVTGIQFAADITHLC